MRYLILALLLGACGTSEVDGPFTGETHRFVVDHITLPTTAAGITAISDDLDGNGSPDDAIGQVIRQLNTDHDITPFADDILASGAIMSTVEIQTRDAKHPLEAGVSYFGSSDAAATPMGGMFDATGDFASNRTAAGGSLGASTIVLPVFIDADPSTLALQHAEVDLIADGRGGYDARIRGLVTTTNARHVAAIGLAQMIMSNPKDHGGAAYFFNTNKDDRVTAAEIESSDILIGMLEPDVKNDADGWLSLAFGAHLSACDAGTCSTSAPVDTCHDRIRDNDETDVDCGGSCGVCGEGSTCMIAGDCSSGSCDAGTCRDWSCHDGVKDGFEYGVDCGNNCGGCKGASCQAPTDCASGSCPFGTCT